MKILTEAMLRSAALGEDTTEYCVDADVFVTPLAREYLRDRRISLVIAEARPAVMTRTPSAHGGATRPTEGGSWRTSPRRSDATSSPTS